MKTHYSKNLLILLFLLISVGSFAQKNDLRKKRRPLFEVNVTKTGPYLGIQRGKYTVAAAGVERQWKRITLRTAQTHAAHTGFNYNFRHNVLGFDLGYWFKPNRIGLTYGGNLFMRTNFDETRVGLAPVIGFKFWIAHLQAGYHFMAPIQDDFRTNQFFVSLRIGLITDRDRELEWAWKNKKK